MEEPASLKIRQAKPLKQPQKEKKNDKMGQNIHELWDTLQEVHCLCNGTTRRTRKEGIEERFQIIMA